jgi:hypothetical protein
MGLSESAIKIITEPVTHLIDNCGRSDCHSKCCNCFEFEIDHHSRGSSRDSDISLSFEKSSKVVI